MARHRAGCAHCARVRSMAQDYRLAREAAEVARERATGGYATETREYAPLITYKQWLQDMAMA